VRTAAGLAAFAALFAAACADTPSPTAPAAAGAALSRAAAGPADDEVVPGEILVKLRDGADDATFARGQGLALGREGYAAAYRVLLTERGNERAAAARLAALPGVEFAEPNYIRRVDDIDDRLWAFLNPGGRNMSFFNDPNGRTGVLPSTYASTADADEDAIEGIGTGGAAVVIGTVDTGVDFAHPEFAGRLIRGCDWYAQAAAGNGSGNCTDTSSDDTPDQGHGTHTTGTMAGSTVGVAGATGAAPNVKVLVQRVCGTNGCYTSSIVNAINAGADYVDPATNQRLVALNLSLGGGTLSMAEKNAIANATARGVLVIASAGNSGTSKVACPACDDNAISVAATTWRDELASYSQYGRGLDIAAPGGLCYSNTTEEGCIFSAIVSGYTAGRSYAGPIAGAAYAYMNGTSMAAPQVTGAAAVVASKAGLRGSALRTRLLGSADDRGAAGYDTRFGNGRLNVFRAVTGGGSTSTQ
jgi:serine protease